jgi:outer membrane protein
MNNKQMKNLIILGLISFCAINAQTQQSLSLSDALKVALSNNFQIQIVKKQTEIAENNDNWSEAGRYPSVNITVGQNNNISDQSNNPTAFIQELLISNSLQGGVALNWNLFSGFAVTANKEKLEQLKEQSKGNEVMVIENTMQAVILAYNDALLQKDKLTLISEVMSLSYDRYEYNKLKKEIGSTSSFELLQVRNAFLSDSINYLLQEIAHENSFRNLKLLLKIDENITLELTDRLIANIETYNVQDLEDKMLDNNANIKNQYINLEIIKQDIRLAKSQMYPTLGFGLGANATNSRFKIADFPAQNGLNINYYGNFSLSFNLFNGGKVKRQLENVAIQEEITNLNIDEAILSLKAQLNTQYKLYGARKIIAGLVKETFNNSRTNLAIAKEKYQTGVINSFDYRDIQLTFLNTGIATLEASYNLTDVHTELLRLTGRLIDQK